MSAEIIAWLRSPEGETWSRNRCRPDSGPAPHMWQHGPGDPAEDPCGRPPGAGLAPEENAATGEEAA